MSQTRRKGIEILRDEISDISRVVNTHSENITRRLERVKDMVAKYCAGKGDTVAASAPSSTSASSAPSSSASSASTSSASASQPFSLSEQSPIPTPTVLGRRLYTIPEETNPNLMESEEVSAPSASAAAASAAAPLATMRSRGPVSWDSFRSKVGEGTNLKTGKSNTLSRISSLWTQAKNGKSASEIEQYLKNELRIEPTLAAAKAPELQAIARNAIEKQKQGATRKSLASAPNSGSAASNAVPSSKKVTRRKTTPPLNVTARVNAALANAARANANANALKATPLTNKVNQTPFKSRPGVQIPTLVPSRSTTTVTNPSTGEEEELSL